ncbi:hypothetical protein GLYMA_07G154950v4 [Glycine max]|nr:hypothetical protein GLYMA_07G154950v4 [Glycine max]KAH1087015.1 hypothetical protein GYH30_018511 [Glycine max]
MLSIMFIMLPKLLRGSWTGLVIEMLNLSQLVFTLQFSEQHF